MAKTQDKTPLVVGGIALAAVAAVLLLKKKGSQAPAFNYQEPTPSPVTPTQPAPTKPVITLNKNLVLKNGSKGNEVKELQKLLGGIKIDGDFGQETEAALVAKKGVKQITLAQFATTATVNQSALKIGDTVMAAKYPTKTTKADKAANGSYFDTKQAGENFQYGEAIGKIVGVSVPTKSHYAVQINSFIFNSYFYPS